MPQYQMPLLILCVLMISCSSNIVNAEVAAQTVDLFKPGETKVKGEGADYPPDGRVPSFDTYSLLDLNGTMAALALGVYRDGSNNLIDEFWAKSSKYENKISDVIGGEWDTQVVVKENNDPNTSTVFYGPKAVVKDGKIFSLLTRSESKAASTTKETKLFVGEVKGGKSITWNASNLSQTFLEAEAKNNSWDQIDASFGRGIVMGGKMIVFPLVAWSTNKKEYICTVIFSEDDGNTWKFPSTPVISEDCMRSSLLEWEGSLLMVHAYPPPQKLYESKDMGKTWTEAHGKLSHLLIDKMDVPALSNIKDFVTATIEGKNVILYTRVGGNVSKKHQFWFADSSRIHYAGQIATDAVDEYSLSTLLYAQAELFAMYDKGGETSRTAVLAHLSNQLDQIKSVLKTWEDVDKRISPPSLTNGLVGFLSNKSDTAKWEDEYLGVNATVKGSATKVDNGLQITLPGTQVVWPIGEQEDNQAYVFTNRGFTVVATVTIHNKPQSVIRLMGVELRNDDSTEEYIWLSYNKHKQWKGVTADEGSGEPNTWEEGKTYQVALIFEDSTGSVYIDGKRLGSLEDPVPPAVPNANGAQGLPSGGSRRRLPRSSQVRAGRSLPLRAISRVSIGEEQGGNQEKKGNQEKEGSQVTVRNVMLYTRPLETSELTMPSSNDNNNTNTKNNTDNTNNDTNTDPNSNTNTTNNNDTNSNTDSNNKNEKKNNKDDNSMYEHVSCLLLVLMGLLGFVTLC